MNKTLKTLALAAASCLILGGCTLPGEQATGSGKDIDYEETLYSAPVQQKEEVINYRWALKPSVTCDNIITPDCSLFDMSNIKYKAYRRISDQAPFCRTRRNIPKGRSA